MTSFGGTTLTNGYRGDSLRAWKQNNGGRTYFLYSGSLLVCELNSLGTVTATNTVGNAGLISRHTSAGSVFYTFDTHSSVAQRLDASGSVLSTQTFDAYGSRLSTDSNADPYAGFGGQSGYYTDWETGTATAALELLTLRYYDPSAGRFLTRDPSGYMGGANSYEYVGNGPTGEGDPLGLFTIGGALGGCAAAFLPVLIQSNPTESEAATNECKSKYDCLMNVLGAVGGLGVSIGCLALVWCAPFSNIVEGCAEGLISSIGHLVVDYYICASKDPCKDDNKDSLLCALIGGAVDIIRGCFSGFLGGALEEMEGLNTIVENLLDGFLIAAADAVGFSAEAGCNSFKH